MCQSDFLRPAIDNAWQRPFRPHNDPPSLVSVPDPWPSVACFIRLHAGMPIPPRSRPQPMPSPSMKLPPGPSFILRQLLSWKFAFYAASIYLACVMKEALGLNVSVWVMVSCPILAVPGTLVAHAQYRYWRDGRKAASLGARLAPTVPTRLPGGIDLITTCLEAFRTGYTIGG